MRKTFSVLLILTLAACFGGNRPSTPDAGSFGADLNTFRGLEGSSALRTHPRLQQAAQAHADDMIRRGYFSHRSVGGPNGETLAQRLAAAGCRPRASAENLAQGQASETGAFATWRGSPNHRANMLGKEYQLYGLAQSGGTWVLVLADRC